MIKQIEYPVGARFQANGQWYEVKRCVGDIVCTDCAFNSKNTRICECGKPDYIPDCIGPFRKDNTNVYYVAIDPPTDVLDTSPLTRPIGSTFYDKGKKMQVCERTTEWLCSKHCYYHDSLCGLSMPIHGLCTQSTRSDKKNIYFKEVKDEKQ